LISGFDQGGTALVRKTLSTFVAVIAAALGVFAAVALADSGATTTTTTTTATTPDTTTTAAGDTTTEATTTDTTTTTDETTTTETTTTSSEESGGGRFCQGRHLQVLASLVSASADALQVTVIKSSARTLDKGSSVTFVVKGKTHIAGKHDLALAEVPAGSLVAIAAVACTDGSYQAKNAVIQIRRKAAPGKDGAQHGHGNDHGQSGDHGKGNPHHSVPTAPATTTTSATDTAPATTTTSNATETESHGHSNGHGHH
jgi:Tfp pilus assembly major pilin PilA